MKTNLRLEHIISLVDTRGFLTVNELSQLCGVSEMTIRRDLERLDSQKRIQRTYGGAASYRAATVEGTAQVSEDFSQDAEVLLIDQVDVLIATSVNPSYDGLLIDRASKKNIPIIAESMEMANQLTSVAVDNFQAGKDLGVGLGQQLIRAGVEKAYLLDLTFHQPNTQLRSRGFLEGLRQACPVELILSINAQSRYTVAYQLAFDTLTVYPQINVIFAINDTTAKGAISACRDLKIESERMYVVPFGLEGDTLRNELFNEGTYCKIALAMFPEIVSLTCVEAAIAAFNHLALPEKYITPHLVMIAETLSKYYAKTAGSWSLNWEYARKHLDIPVMPGAGLTHPDIRMPGQVGFLIPFTEHDWYRSLTSQVKALAKQKGIGIQVIDAEKNVRDEVEFRRRQIAKKAASLVEPNDVVLVDGGPMAAYLAEELKLIKDITVITDSVVVFDALNPTPGITLISTGGTLRYSSQVMVGPTAESALKELRADKLFLMVSGISLDFGLSHHTISEITMKQGMIRSAREIILLADHTSFDEEAGIQVAPLTVVHKLITDTGLTASVRLNISKAGVQIILV